MRIVISADGSVEGDAARQWCAANARPGDEVIAVVGADQLSDVMLSVSPLMGVADPQLLRESVERRLESDLSAVGVSYESRVSYHGQAKAVIETAEAEHADLIVVGKRPRAR